MKRARIFAYSITLFVAVLAASPLAAATETINGVEWTYTVSDGKASVGDYYGDPAIPTSTTGEITIPITLGGYPVTSIGNSAFKFCNRITSITIPDSVTSIGSEAFYCCYGLRSFTIPDSVTSIGSDAFYDLRSLCDTWTIPGVALVDGWAVGLTGSISSSLDLTGIRGIASLAFRGCTGLTSVTINQAYTLSEIFPSAYKSITNVIIIDSATSIRSYTFKGCSGLTSVTIPGSVTSIGGSAFEGCSGLTSVTIPDSVTSIGAQAFYGCSGLSSVTIPDSVTDISWNAFRDCSGLTSVTIGNSVTSIGDYAFSGCSGLTSVTIPDSVTSIGNAAFSYCSGLMAFDVSGDNPCYKSVYGLLMTKDGRTVVAGVNGAVTIPNSVTDISWNAFKGCSGLMSVMIPDSVTNIGKYAFSDFSGLTSVTINQTVCNSGLSKIFPSVYKSITNVAISDSVTSIGDYAFYGCSGLTSVTIPDSVTSIGDRAFGGCLGIERIYTSIAHADTFTTYSLDGKCIWTDAAIGGDTAWTLDRDTVRSGSVGWRSGKIGHGQESWFELDVDYGGTLSFWWKASSESDGDEVYDYAFLSVDGEAKGSLDNYKLDGTAIGGKTDWVNVVIDVSGAGPHTIRWTYCKDDVDMAATGDDCVWLDDIVWTPKVSVSYDISGANGVAPSGDTMLAGAALILPDATGFSWEDHVFCGWSDGNRTCLPGDTYEVPRKEVTFTAQWIRKSALTFVLDGGSGTAPTTIKEVPGTKVTLPLATGLSRAKHSFGGWSNGAATYNAGAEYVIGNQDVAFVAVWTANTLAAPVISSADVSNGGTIEAAYATIAMSAEAGAEIRYTTDGSVPTAASPRFTAPFVADGMNVTIKAIAVRDNCFDSDVAAFSFTRKPYSLSECLGMDGVTVTAGGDSSWERVLGGDAYDGVAALKSGTLDNSQTNWVQVTVSGPGTISFWWKVSSEGANRGRRRDGCLFTVDCEEAAWSDGTTNGWTQVTVEMPGPGAHTLKWTYGKNDNGTTAGEDCAWLDEVVWSPTPSAIVTFDANGGEGGCTARMSIGTTLGEMPVPSLEFHEFQGWFTAPNGGERVTLDTIVDGDLTYYAHWTFVGGKVMWKNIGTDAIAWDGNVINESNLDFMIPATEDLPKGAKVKIDKIKLASLNSAFAGWDPTTSKSDPSYVRLNGVNSDLCSAFSGTISSTDTISDNALVYTFSTPCEVIVGKKYGAVTGNNSGDVGDGIAFLHSNGNLLYGSYADRASVRYIKTDGADSIMSTTVAPDGYYPAYEIEAELVELHPSAFDTQALEYTAIFTNHTIKSIQGGWFKGSVSFDGGTPQNTNLRIGPSEKFDQALQTSMGALPWRDVSSRGFVFSMALYADVSDMPKDGKAIMVAIGNGNTNSAVLFRDGNAVRFAFVDADGGIVGEAASVEAKIGYHLYCVTCDPETGDLGLSLDGATVVKGGAEGVVVLGNGFQIGSVFYRRPGDFIAGTGMAIIKLLGYDAILSAGDIQTLSVEYPAVEERICELGAIEKPNTTVTIVDGQSVALDAGAANLERLIVKGGLAKVRVTEELDVNGYTASFAEIINGGSLAFVSENGADISSDRVEITVTDGIAKYTLKPRPQPQNNVEVGDKGLVEEGATGGYVVTAKDGEMLTEADFSFPVVAKEAYKVEIAEGGKVATITLNAPEIGVPIEQAEDAPKDEADVSGMLVEVEEAMISAKPTPEAGESVGALPVKTYVGLWYQVSWGDDLGGLETGEKVQATGEKLYLGVIKQTGDKGFYKVTVSEK